LFNYKLT